MMPGAIHRHADLAGILATAGIRNFRTRKHGEPAVGNRARIYGLNTIGLMRRGFTSDVVTRLKRSFRYLLQSKLNTTGALAQIEADATLACPEVQYLIDFIRSSERGVILRRATRRTEDLVSDD